MHNLIFLDTETTGIEATDYLCQIAYKTKDETVCELFKPPLRIPPEASAVTHITNKMVADKPAFKDSALYGTIKTLLEAPEAVLIAHNALFDIQMIAKEGIVPTNYIDTLKIARYLDKDGKFSMYKLQYLRYALDIEIEAPAHDALGDVLVLEKVFDRMLQAMIKETGSHDAAIARMIEISGQPMMMGTFNFGKYNGQKVVDVAKTDAGYLEWLLVQKLQKESGEEDWIYTLKHYLKK